MRWIVAGFLLFSSVLMADEQKEKAPQNLEELKQKIQTTIEYQGVNGISVALVDQDGQSLITGIGLADKEKNIASTAETLFRIGSVTKMFVSLSALKLEQEGKLDFNTPIKELLPNLEFENPWSDTDPVLVVHLLEHTAGWDDIHLAEYANNDPSPLTLQQGIDFHPDSRVSRWRPGDRMSYANSGPPVVALAIEKITGMRFEDYVQQNFFNPLGMNTATYFLPEQSLPQATLYEMGKPSAYWHILMRPSGSINASANDMAGLVQFFINRGKVDGVELLPESAIERMERPMSSLAARAGLTLGYGLSNYTTSFQGHVFHGHNGGINGGLAEFAYLPEANVGYAIIINSGKGMALREVSKLIKTYLTRDLVAPDKSAKVELPQQMQQQYGGYYVPVNPRQEMSRFVEIIFSDISITLNDDGMNIVDGDEYAFVGDGLFRKEEDSQASAVLMQVDGQNVLQLGSQYYEQTSSFLHFLKLAIAWTFIGLVATHLLWFWVWLVRRINKKLDKGPSMSIRLWPFFASLSIAVFIGMMILGQLVDAIAMLGKPTIVSWMMTLATVTFAICSIVGFWTNWKYRGEALNKVAKIYCLFSCVIFTVVTLYFAELGVIGLRTFG